MTTKEYLVKVSYDNAGMTQMKQDFETATGAARFMGASISNEAKLIDQNVTTGFTHAGQAVRNVTSILNDQGKITKVVFQDMGNSIKMVSQSAQTFGTVAGSLSGELEKVVGRALLVAPAWMALRFAISSVVQVFQQSVSFMVEWETTMARIQIVTGATKEQLDVLSGSLLAMSEKFGISNKDLGDNANLWLRMGANLNTVIPLLETTSKLSLISGKSMEDSSKAINSIISSFGLNTEQAGTAIEKLIGIEQKSGVSLEVLLDGFSKAGVKAQQSGVSFDQLAGYITAVNEKTRQSGELIGTQLASMFTRLGTTGIQTAQALSGVAFYLDATGKQTTIATPTLRNMNDIVTELAQSWKTLSTVQQDALAKSLGGNLRATTVIALLENFNAAVKASSTSVADAEQDVNKITDTTANRVKQLQGAWGRFIDSVSNTGIMQTVLNQIQQRIDAITLSINAAHMSWDFLFNRSEFDKKVAAFKQLEEAQRKASQASSVIGATPNSPKEGVDVAYTEAGIKMKMQEIEEKALLTRQDSLATVKEELALIGDGITADGKDITSQVQALTLKKEKLEVERELARLNENQNVIAAQLKADGASELQLAIQKLAYLQAINDTEGAAKQKTVVDIASINQYKTVQDDIINTLLSEQKTLGETALQQIQNKIALEDQLGIHLEGVDLLKQQLDLYKAITSESQKTPQQRQKELSDLIKKTPTPEKTGFANTFRNEQEESHLTKEALSKGISRDVIDAILHPNLKTGTGGQNSLQDDLKRGLSDPLNTNIANLAHTISNLAEAISRPSNNLDLTSNARYRNPEASMTTNQQRTDYGWESSRKGPRTVSIDLGGITIGFTAHNKTELTAEVKQNIQDLIQAHILKPGTKLNKAIQDVIEKF